nr:immunoglobulin light chain junction region [Macaca mulatta]
CQQGYNAPWTF